MKTVEQAFTEAQEALEACNCDECRTRDRTMFFVGMNSLQQLMNERADRQDATGVDSENDWEELNQQIMKAAMTDTAISVGAPIKQKGYLH